MQNETARMVKILPVIAVTMLTGCAGMENIETPTAERPVEVRGRVNVEPPPKGAVVLFDGSDFSRWTNESGGPVEWKIIGDVMEVAPRGKEDFPDGNKPKKVGIQTKRAFEDFRLHVEFMIPPGEQDNSGVYIQRRYEIQIVDSYAGRTHSNNCGAIYKQKQPDVIASMPPGTWQSYDITFRAARYRNGVKVENARVTVYHNNVLIQDDIEIFNKTGNGDEERPGPAPTLLQDHGCKTRFRNVWLVEL